MARLRIGYARIAQESNCFSPVLTTLEDFRRCHWLEGEELARACSLQGVEAQGYIKHAELTGAVEALAEDRDVEAVPLFSAWSIPGGPIEPAAFDALKGRLEESIKDAGRLHGLVLCLHGAMGAVGVIDPDTELLRAARRALGAAPIAVTHDLHANLTQERVTESDILVGYRTNPHRDQRRTGYVAAKNLLKILRTKKRPTTAWRSLPILLGGGATVDVLPPVRSIFARLSSLHRDPRVMNASVMFCHPWNDEPRLGWSAHVTTEADPTLAEDLADELADRLWAVRHEQPPRFLDPKEAIERARDASLARRLGVVAISDASDVVSAGAPGDSTNLLASLIEDAKDMTSYAPLRDPKVVAALWDRAEGSSVRVEAGAKLDPSSSAPLCFEAKLAKKLDHPSLGRMVLLDLGHVKLVVTEGHAMAVKPAFYGDMGLSPWKADIAVVKNFFPFRIFFAPYARKVFYVQTRGATDLQAAFRLPLDGPVWPRDPVQEWRSTDARRRSLTSPRNPLSEAERNSPPLKLRHH